MSLIVYTAEGVPLNLHDEIGEGGEGAIFASPSRSDECAKVYSHPLSAEDNRKLHLMVSNPPSDPTYETRKHHSIAWPSALLYGDPHSRNCVGFIMPRLETRDFLKAICYLDPKDRKRYFGGGFNWKYIFTAGFNIVSSVAAIHERGYCIGDLNESNILVAPSALIALIDCDSFQVSDSRSGLVYRCAVGKPEYTAPEIQGKSYRDIDRTRETDCFALAVLLFQFMMAGTHPYQAKGRLVEDAPSTQAKLIKGVFPYFSHRKDISPPDYAPPFEIVPPQIRELFRRCFVDGHGNPSARPSAREWFEVMKKLGDHLRRCRENENHLFHDHLSSCPWCQIRKEKGEDPFPSPLGQQFALDPKAAASESLEKRLEAFRPYLLMAFADGVLTVEEEAQLKALGSKLHIPSKEVEKAIQNEAKKVQVKSPTATIGQPRLEISRTQFEFQNLRGGATVQGNFVLTNVGGGTLQGPIKSSRKWLKLLQTAIDPSRHRQEITFNVDTSALALGFKERGEIEIRSNAGTVVVGVNVSVEVPEDAIGRFRRSAFWIGALVGGAFGFFLYQLLPSGPERDVISAVAGITGIVASIVLGARMGKFAGGCGGFIVSLIVLGAIENTLPQAFSTLSWAITYGTLMHATSRLIFVAKQTKNKSIIPAIGIVAVLLATAVIGIGIWGAEQAFPPPVTSLQGSWVGSYSGSSEKTTSFEAEIQQKERDIIGRITEIQPGSRGASTSTRLFSKVTGMIQGDIVRFQKRYSTDQAVSYSGRVAGDHMNMSGTWAAGSASGTWEMHKLVAPPVQQNQAEPVAPLHARSRAAWSSARIGKSRSKTICFWCNAFLLV